MTEKEKEILSQLAAQIVTLKAEEQQLYLLWLEGAVAQIRQLQHTSP